MKIGMSHFERATNTKVTDQGYLAGYTHPYSNWLWFFVSIIQEDSRSANATCSNPSKSVLRYCQIIKDLLWHQAEAQSQK